MAKEKDQDDPKPEPARSRRSAVADITEKLPVLPELGGDDDPEPTKTDPDARVDRRPARLRSQDSKPAPAPARKVTPSARPAPPLPVATPSASASQQPVLGRPPPTLGEDEEESEHEATVVADQLSPHYSGNKAGLKPVFDAILEAAKRLGQVKVIPGPRYVTLMRNREFAILEETPQGDRVELGLVLPGRPPTRRLNRARHFEWGDRFTHHVTLRYRTDVDSEVRSWLTDACWTGG